MNQRVMLVIEFRFGEGTNPNTAIDEVVPIPNTAKEIPLYVYVISAIMLIAGIGVVGLLTTKKTVK